MAIRTIGIILFLCVFKAQTSVYETHQHIERAGYVAETHHVTTQDGYILEMHRIPFRRNENTGDADRPIVFIMHGLTAASSHYIALGSQYSLAYNLADAGFDVWLGNARGNRLSRRHVTLDPDDSATRVQFFDFTWHEIGSIDVPTMVDYILEHTGRPQLHYIGHSQGGTSFLVMTSTRPEYNQRIASAHLLAGVGYKTHFPNTALRNLARLTDQLWALARNLGIVEIFPPNNNNTRSVSNKDSWENCFGDPSLQELCILTGVTDFMRSAYNTTEEVLPELEIGGGSLKQFAHYGQNINNDGIFRQWDYGAAENIARYGTSESPIYNISLITVNVTMHYTISDNLLDPRDVYAMAVDIPNCIYRRVARESFTHEDFAAATDARELVTDYIIDAIRYVHSSASEDEHDSIGPAGPESTDSSSTVSISLIIQLFFVTYCLHLIF